MSSPAVRKAIADQTESIGDEMIDSAPAGDVRAGRPDRGARRAGSSASRRGRPRRPTRFGGRRVARRRRSALDALFATVVVSDRASPIVVARRHTSPAGSAPAWLADTLAATGWAIAQVVYFAGFWSGTGRTPGMHLMGVRVHGPDGRATRLRAGRSSGSSASGSRSRSRSSASCRRSPTGAAARCRTSSPGRRSTYDDRMLALSEDEDLIRCSSSGPTASSATGTSRPSRPTPGSAPTSARSAPTAPTTCSTTSARTAAANFQPRPDPSGAGLAAETTGLVNDPAGHASGGSRRTRAGRDPRVRPSG